MAGHRSANRPSSHLTNNPQHIRRAQPPRLNDDDKPIDLPGETFGLIFNPTAGLGQQAAKSGAFVVGRSDPASSARHMGEL
jgi:hypothetical protein